MTRSALLIFSSLVAPAMLAQPIAAQSSAGVDQVIVTAQKRPENAQEVPISISTLDEEELTTIFQSGEDIRALAVRIPGLYAESSNGRVAPRFYIRGLGNTDFDLAASQPVSVIMDDVVMENVVLKSFPLFDMAGVEVLRGPQGSLFGRNTPAGIVKFESAKPTEELTGFGSVSYGTYDSIKGEAAVSGALIEDRLSARLSGLYNSRDDYIDNGFTGQEDVFGDYRDVAGRLQLLFTPNENVDVLLNVHARDLDATSALFRANIIGPRSNRLNDNFDRDQVFFDQGNGNEQDYEQQGGSLKIDWDFGAVSMTSITGYETAEGSSRGDIDGGAGVGATPNTGFIPFQSDTQDAVDDTNQFTQEIRFYNSDTARFNWQAGVFYFDSDLSVTTNPFFAPPTTVRHDNTSWSIFGQGSYDLTEKLTVTAGARYTDDEKDLIAVAANLPVAPVSVSDDEISWDVSANFEAAQNVNLYARVAKGFRAPTIQARDVAFFGAPTTATSEKIQSYEIGMKSEFWQNRARLNAAAYYYDANDLQFSAIGGLGNFNQLVNADGRGQGFEVDFEFVPTDNFEMTAGLAYADTKITEDNLSIAPCGGGCTVLDPLDALGNAIVEGNPFPQAPDVTFNWTARYSYPIYDGELYAYTDWAYQGETNFFLYESAEFYSDNNVEGGLRVGYLFEDGKYDVAVFARNITDNDNLKGAIDFNNLTGFVNEPRIIGIAASGSF